MNQIKKKLYEEIKKQGLSIDLDVFDYGVAILKQYFICLFFSFVIGSYFKCIFEMILTIVFWSGIRRYIGGFHFENSTLCLFFTVLIIICISKISRFLSVILVFDFIFSVLALIIIMKFGCIDHKNKPLSVEEKIYYKGRAIKRVYVYIILELVFRLISFNSISNIILLVLQLSSINLLISTLVNKEKIIL
ncbi:MAG: accessory gene regulator B family protein [Bacillota bacterium]|nr:accessory gene regulator B family protein [Bacillota bacterium]